MLYRRFLILLFAAAILDRFGVELFTLTPRLQGRSLLEDGGGR
ncbi:MAG: hypothetical protein WCU88_08040 [Elusimicrobiota bacterium]